jgi:hypothetical protein
VLVITRHRPGDVASFVDVARDAFAALADRPGFVTARLGRATEDPAMFVVSTEWADAGSYRRALSPVDVRVRTLPLFNTAIDELGVFEIVYGVTADGLVIERPSDAASDPTQSRGSRE